MAALLTLLPFLLPSVLLAAVGKSNVNVTGYVIDLQLDPANHAMTATAQVTFTAPATISTAVFELHNALKVDKVTDAAGHPLAGQRGADTTIGVVLPAPMNKGASATFTFNYSGTLSGGEDGPVEGLKLASIGDPISYLLYAARWFPMAGYQTDRFTAEIHVQVPQGYRVVGSGSTGAPHQVGSLEEYDFSWTKPGFPGTIIAGKFNEPMAIAGSAMCASISPTLTKTAARTSPNGGEGIRFLQRRLRHRLSRPGSTSSSCPTIPCPPTGRPEIAAIAGARMPTAPTSACWPTPWPTNGGAA